MVVYGIIMYMCQHRLVVYYVHMSALIGFMRINGKTVRLSMVHV